MHTLGHTDKYTAEGTSGGGGTARPPTPPINGSHPWVLSLHAIRGGREGFEQLSCQKQTVAVL